MVNVLLINFGYICTKIKERYYSIKFYQLCRKSYSFLLLSCLL